MKKFLVMCLCLITLFLTACGKPSAGKYRNAIDEDGDRMPTITLNDDNTCSISYFANFKLGATNGTYEISDDQLTIFVPSTDESEPDNEYIFDIDKDKNLVYSIVSPTRLKMLGSDNQKPESDVPYQTVFSLEK